MFWYFQEFARRIVVIYQPLFFPSSFCFGFQDFNISFFRLWKCFLTFVESFWVSWFSKDNSYWCWESLSGPLGPKTRNMKGFRIVPKWNRKWTNPKWGRIVLTELLGLSLIEIYNDNAPPRPPKTPLPDFSWILPAFRASDEAFLKDLAKNCKTKEEEWAVRQKVRAEELLAIADTIKLLKLRQTIAHYSCGCIRKLYKTHWSRPEQNIEIIKSIAKDLDII